MPVRSIAAAVAAAALLLAGGPAFAAATGAPPVAAPREEVTVAPLPPVHDPSVTPAPAPAVAAPAPAPAVAPPREAPWWGQPFVYAAIALIATLIGFGATMLYMRKPSPGALRVAITMTGASAVFILVALVVWLL